MGGGRWRNGGGVPNQGWRLQYVQTSVLVQHSAGEAHWQRRAVGPTPRNGRKVKGSTALKEGLGAMNPSPGTEPYPERGRRRGNDTRCTLRRALRLTGVHEGTTRSGAPGRKRTALLLRLHVRPRPYSRAVYQRGGDVRSSFDEAPRRLGAQEGITRSGAPCRKRIGL